MSLKPRVTPRPFETRVVVAVLITVTILALFAVVWQSAQVFFLVFGGVLLAVVLRSAGCAIARWTGFDIRWTVGIVIVATLLAVAASFWFVMPDVAEQFQTLRESLGESLEKLKARAAQSSVGGTALEHANNAGSSFLSNGTLFERVAGGFSTLLSVAAGLIVILTVGIFLALSPSAYTAGLLRLLPPHRRKRASDVIEKLGATLQGWIVGQLISMLFLFTTTWLMLALMGVPLAFLLGVITGIMAFVPYIGPIVAAVPIVLVAFTESPALALQVGVLYLVIQTIETNVVLPLVFQSTVELPPALLITGQLVLGGIFGILGLIFATPLTALTMVLVQQLYVEDTLKDSMQQEAGDLPELAQPS